MRKRFVALCLIGAVIAGSLVLQSGAVDTAAAALSRPDNVEPALFDRLVTRGSTDFVVIMVEQADLSDARSLSDWQARGRAVYDALRETARRTQAPVAAYAERHNLTHRAFFSTNSVYVEAGSLRAVLDIAALPGVALVRTARVAHILPGFTMGPTAPDAYGWNLDTLAPGFGQYGMQAAQVWDAHDARGEGVVVANIDTGVYYQHEALVRQYRGNLGAGQFDHDYNWYMPTEGCGDGTAPCDNHSHGTGTMGIMVGETEDLSEQTGAAPAAEWIACKGCEVTTCSEAALVGCADWMLAPCPIGATPGDPACDPDRRPHIVNNSWGDTGGDDWYRGYIQAWVAAGIFPAFSAGNTNGCRVLGSPGDNPEAFGTAAHYSNGAHLYAGGPSQFFPEPSCDPSAHQIDPHLSAPTYGRAPGNSPDAYFSLSGTSGASPHTAGAVALMWSTSPLLVGDVDVTFTLLEQSTNHDVPLGSCGKPDCATSSYPNYSYGWGYLDALAAVEMAMEVGAAAVLEGTLTDSSTGAPLPGVDVVATLSTTRPVYWSVVTGADGYYHIDALSSTYTLDTSAYGYWPLQEPGVVLTAGLTTTRDLTLAPRAFYTVSGVVTDAVTGWPLYARIDIDEYPGSPIWTDPETGEYAVSLAEGLTHTLHVGAWISGYETVDRAIGPLTADRVENVALPPDASACTAPGRYRTFAVFETFDGTDVPAGWTVVDNAIYGQVWRFDDPSSRGNLTGGEGGFAIVDSHYYGSFGRQDTELISPVMDFTGYDAVAVRFRSDFYRYWSGEEEVADVDVSTDGGSSWTNVWRRTGASDRGPNQEDVDLTGLAAGEPDVQVRFRYYNAEWEWWWQVDEVFVGDPTCKVFPGGLVVGAVLDANTGAGLPGAVVAAGDGTTTITEATPEDDAVADGFYTRFLPAGTHTLTATLAGYAPAAVTTTVVASQTVRRDITLPAGYPTYSPASLEAAIELGLTTTLPLTLTNDGALPLVYTATETAHDVAWLDAAPVTGTLSPAASARISVTLDAGAAEVTQPGLFGAGLTFETDTAYSPDHVPVTMTVQPPESWGKLAGAVTSLGYCDADPAPLEGAEVRIESSGGLSWTVTTAADGTYAWWLDEARSPLTVTVVHTEHVSLASPGVIITRGLTTTTSFDVRWLRPCIDAGAFETISATLWMGTSVTMPLTITNTGAASTPFTFWESWSGDGGCAGGEDVGWLSEDPVSGTVDADGVFRVDLVIDALPSMGAGTYDAVLSLCTSDPENGTIAIPARLRVTAETIHLPVVMRDS